MFTQLLLATVCLGQADPQLDAVLADWSTRYDQFASVEYEVEGMVVTTPDFVAGLGSGKDLPDKPLPIKVHAKLDFKSGRAWMRREAFQWQIVPKEFQLKVTETTVNGDRTRVVKHSPPSEKRSSRTYEGPSKTWGILQLDVTPIWLNSGLVPVSGLRSSLFSPSPDDVLRKLRRITNSPEKSDGRFQLAVPPTSPTSLRYLLTLDGTDQNVITGVDARDPMGI
ncbi:MAG: hypothetical protein H8E66_01870 [Planctomycetes bacterium]|nr:hypothetical protein [Planctomycetota bacterium]